MGSPPDVESARPVEDGPRSGAPAGAPRRRRHRSRLLLVVVGLVLVAVLVVVLVISRHGGPASAPPSTGPQPTSGPHHTSRPHHTSGPLPTPVVPVKQVAPNGGPRGVSWHLQFDEGFAEGKDALLASGVWHSGWFGDGQLTDKTNSEETALFSRDNVSIAHGRARLVVTPNTDHASLDDGTTEPNLGAALNTDPSQAPRGFTMTYGYAEARMQLPAAPVGEQVWPSFWLNGETWPDDMEIDVVEGDGTDQGNKFNIHYGTNNHDTTTLNDVGRERTVPGATTGWHTYGVEVRPDGVTFYYDGAVVYAYEGHVPDVPRYLMIGESTSGHVSTARPLLVDYVRTWTRAAG